MRAVVYVTASRGVYPSGFEAHGLRFEQVTGVEGTDLGEIHTRLRRFATGVPCGVPDLLVSLARELGSAGGKLTARQRRAVAGAFANLVDLYYPGPEDEG